MRAKTSKEYNEFFNSNFTGVIEYCDGTLRLDWISIQHLKNGKLHNENWVAIEWLDGNKQWYLNDKCHRENGPAIESVDAFGRGDLRIWRLNGKYYSKKEWEMELEKYK
jgi:hypothetical protein